MDSMTYGYLTAVKGGRGRQKGKKGNSILHQGFSIDKM